MFNDYSVTPAITTPSMESTFYIEIPRFYDGLIKLTKISKELAYVLRDAMTYCVGNDNDDAHCERQAIISFMESIQVPHVRDGVHYPHKQRIVYMEGTEFHYLTRYGMLIGWKQRTTGDPRSTWIFWVNLPTADFHEYGDRRNMVTNLTAAGFTDN